MNRRTISLTMEDSLSTSVSARQREILNAIHTRNPKSLLSSTFTRGSISPIRTIEEKTDSTLHLIMLKKSIDIQKLTSGTGDKTVLNLKNELKQLELEDAKHEFWLRQCTHKIKNLQKSIEKALERQSEETWNQEIYHHLLKRMKKTKIFLEMKSYEMMDCLECRDLLLLHEKKKKLVKKEAALQAVTTFKAMKKAVDDEKNEGENQIYSLQKSINKVRTIADRTDVWKNHQQTMYEAAAIEDRSAKNQRLKEGLTLHRLWHNILTKIFDRKVEKSRKFEEAFQKIKIATGIPDITILVENFLTKEQTYDSLMKTVNKKEIECSEYKNKINEIQKNVEMSSNKDVSASMQSFYNDLFPSGTVPSSEVLNTIRGINQQKVHELMELSHKKFLIENTHSKIRTWLLQIIKKFYRILGTHNNDIEKEESLIYYIKCIKEIFALAHGDKGIGIRVEANRKYALNSLIKQAGLVPHKIFEDEQIYEGSLVAAEVETEERINTRPH